MNFVRKANPEHVSTSAPPSVSEKKMEGLHSDFVEATSSAENACSSLDFAAFPPIPAPLSLMKNQTCDGEAGNEVALLELIAKQIFLNKSCLNLLVSILSQPISAKQTPLRSILRNRKFHPDYFLSKGL